MMKPVLLGSLMGAMMLAMLHGPIMDGSLSLGGTSLAFVAAHVLVAVILGGALMLAPSLRRHVAAHRPRLAHMAGMGVGALGSTALIHFVVHGGLV